MIACKYRADPRHRKGKSGNREPMLQFPKAATLSEAGALGNRHTSSIDRQTLIGVFEHHLTTSPDKSKSNQAPELARSRDYFTRVTGRGWVNEFAIHDARCLRPPREGTTNRMITAQRNDICVRNDTRAQLLTEAHDGHRAAAAAASSSDCSFSRPACSAARRIRRVTGGVRRVTSRPL